MYTLNLATAFILDFNVVVFIASNFEYTAILLNSHYHLFFNNYNNSLQVKAWATPLYCFIAIRQKTSRWIISGNNQVERVKFYFNDV